MAERSRLEIEKWTRILAKAPNGRERLQWYLASLVTGCEFLEPVQDCLERRGLTEFFDWARPYARGEA